MADQTVDREALRRARQRSGKRITEVAAAVGCDRAYLGRVESGARNPSIELAYLLAREIGVPPETFILAEREAEAS